MRFPTSRQQSDRQSSFTFAVLPILISFFLTTAFVTSASATSILAPNSSISTSPLASSISSASASATATADTTSVFTSTNFGLGSTPLERHALTAQTARSIIAAAVNNATLLGAAETIAIVDLAGFLLAFERMDNAFLGGVDIAIKKARGAALFNGIATTELYAGNLAAGGLVGVQDTNGGLAFYPGGMALYKDGFLLGAVGCSGGSVAQDTLIAQAAADHLAELAS